MNEIPIRKHTPGRKRQAYIAGKALKTGFRATYKLGLVKHRKPRTRALIVHGDCFLVVNTARHRDQLSLPGGGIKEDETPARACAREIQEEVGLRVSSAVLTEIGYYSKEQTGQDYEIVCFLYDIRSADKKTITLSREIYDARWVPFASLPDNLPPLLRLALTSYVEYVRSNAS